MAISARYYPALERRGLDVELLDKYGVSDSDRRGFEIVIPYFERGALVGRKHRRIVKSDAAANFTQDPGSKQIFWNHACLEDPTLSQRALIICEGEFDALTAIQAGFGRVVSVPNGAPVEGEHEGGRYQYLCDVPEDAKEIVLAVDGDEPGKRLLHMATVSLGNHRCKWVEYPKGCKDLNDVLRVSGIDGVRQVIHCARWMPVPGLYRMSDLPALPEHPPLEVGIPGLDKHYRARLGDFTVVTGIPNHGKTQFVITVACHMALKHKWPVAMASFEMRPQVELRRNLRTWYCGGLEKDLLPGELARVDDWINDWFRFIVPNIVEDDATVPWMLERLRAAVTRDGVKLVVIDPWNELDHDPPPDMTRTEYVGWCIRQLKRFAMKYLVHVIVVAHPAKLQRDKGEISVPTLYDIADSAHWVNKPDVGIIIHRKSQDETMIRIAKSRFQQEVGVPGDVSVKYVWQRANYENYEDFLRSRMPHGTVR